MIDCCDFKFYFEIMWLVNMVWDSGLFGSLAPLCPYYWLLVALITYYCQNASVRFRLKVYSLSMFIYSLSIDLTFFRYNTNMSHLAIVAN